MTRIERIERMEECLNRSDAAQRAAVEALAALRAVQDDLHALEDYYGSKAWHADREADEAGALPAGLRRGVLTEDAVYDLLRERHALAIRMLETATGMLR